MREDLGTELDKVLWQVFHDDDAEGGGTKGLSEGVEGDGSWMGISDCTCYGLLEEMVYPLPVP